MSTEDMRQSNLKTLLSILWPYGFSGIVTGLLILANVLFWAFR